MFPASGAREEINPLPPSLLGEEGRRNESAMLSLRFVIRASLILGSHLPLPEVINLDALRPPADFAASY